MGKQLEIFPPQPLTEAELVDARLAEARAERFAREATRPSPFSRDQRRSRRKRDVRARTISTKRMTKGELERGRAQYPAEEHADVRRPQCREECAGVPRPCPFVACRHHLYLDVSARTGAIKLNFPDLEPHDLPADASCALDIAERDGVTLEAVGHIMNLTRERVRQLEVKALAKLEAAAEMHRLRDLHGDSGPVGKRRLPILEQVEFDAEEFASVTLDAD